MVTRDLEEQSWRLHEGLSLDALSPAFRFEFLLQDVGMGKQAIRRRAGLSGAVFWVRLRHTDSTSWRG